MSATRTLGQGSCLTFGVSLGGPFVYGVPEPAWFYSAVEEIEDLGYDAVWVSDHIVTPDPIQDSLILLAAFAARTRRILLGTGVFLLALRHPTLAAKSLSILDLLSEGRVILGVGVGGEFPKEFEACGVSTRERGPRTNEALDVIRQLWREEHVTHRGRFFSLEDVSLKPPPAQQGGPPVWIGGRTEAALRRAVERGDGWISYLVTPERFRRSLESLGELARKNGKNLENFSTSHLHFLFVSDSLEKARKAAVDNLIRTYHQPFDPLVDKYCALGPPEACEENLWRYYEAGVRHIVLRPTCPTEEFLPQLRRFSREVIPKLKKRAS